MEDDTLINTYINLPHSFALISVSDEQVAKSMKMMAEGMLKVKQELEQHEQIDHHDKFGDKMEAFLEHSEGHFERVQEQHEVMEKEYKELAKFYCFDIKKMSSEEFFRDLSTFCKEFEVF